MTHDDLELKRAMAALPREIEPPVDAWPAIRAKLETGQPATGDRRHGSRVARMRIAALLTLLAISAGTLTVTRHNAGRWELSSAALTPRPFAVGDQFVSGRDSARLKVGTIGDVAVAAGSEVRLIQAKWSEHRLALARGSIHARISAPPRLFIVETPTGTAVDLGCEYTLDVDASGNTTLDVTAGWVSFEDHGRASLIPAGMRAITRRGGAVGTPFMTDAPDALRAALTAFDAGDHGDTVIATVLHSARPRDAVTLWHIVQRSDGDARRRVFQRLIQLVPPPDGVTADAVLDDTRMMTLYWTKLPGALPIVPEWQEKLWRLWLRVAG